VKSAAFAWDQNTLLNNNFLTFEFFLRLFMTFKESLIAFPSYDEPYHLIFARMNDLGQWFPAGEEFHEFGRNFHFVVELPIQCNSCASFKVDIGFLNYFYHFMFISYWVDYRTFLLTNFSAINWEQIVFVPRRQERPLFQL